MGSVLLEAKPYRPFKSSEEYLEAMKEDLAEWLNFMYPELNIKSENFMEQLDTGVALCKHANNVRKAAEEYLAKRQARHKSMIRSMTSGLAGPILANLNVHYLPTAKSGTFFARDNVSNFITWCRKSLKIFECLLFETDDLIMRKNEKHVILCLLEVARRGAKFGMLAPMLVQMERQIDREIAAENKANAVNFNLKIENISLNEKSDATDLFDSDTEDEDESSPTLLYGPHPQIVTNDLKSLDEMVRELVEICTCPSQFPMVRVSEGKYRIGDTKILIFVRILRSHVMVRVGGGWDTLAHYLDKHDPCRCKSTHRPSVAAKLVTRTNPQSNYIELHKANVIYERSPTLARKTFLNQEYTSGTPGLLLPNNNDFLGTLNSNYIKNRSPNNQRKFLNQQNIQNTNAPFLVSALSNMNRRSMSPSPRRLSDIRKKQVNDVKISFDSNGVGAAQETVFENSSHPNEYVSASNGIGNNTLTGGSIDYSIRPDNISDNGSEISDEGYRSLGLQQNANLKTDIYQQIGSYDVESSTRCLQDTLECRTSPKLNNKCEERRTNSFEKLGIYITEDGISVDIADATGLKKTGFVEKNCSEDDPYHCSGEKSSLPHNRSDNCNSITSFSKIPRSPKTVRRSSIDTLTETNSLVHKENSSFNRTLPEYRSALSFKESTHMQSNTATLKKNLQKGSSRELNLSNNTWNGRNKTKYNASLHDHPVRSSSLNSHFDKKLSYKNSHIIYDSNGKRVCSKSTSLTTSPVKTKPVGSPLAQKLLKVANNAKDDAQMLEKMKNLLRQYENERKLEQNPKFNYKGSYTSEWVQNNGDFNQLEKTKVKLQPESSKILGRTLSTTSSHGSNNLKDTYATKQSFIPKNRNDYRGSSKIPAPIQRNVEII